MKFWPANYIYLFLCIFLTTFIFLPRCSPAYATDSDLDRYFKTYPSHTTTTALLKSTTLPKLVAVTDDRVDRLSAFLDKYHSPLSEYADTFILVADKYNLDWRLLPAITGVESTFGRFIPRGSYNAYGWNRGDYYFNSWEHSIDYIGMRLSEKYMAQGLTTPSKIASKYAPDSTTWASTVNKFISQIDSTEI